MPREILGGIADELLIRIEEDNRSRQEWLDTRARGIEILGLKIEAMRSSGADGSAPLEGQSQIRASLLCEAVVRFGANAFSELCPTDGPAKVTEDTAAATVDLDDLADALEKVLNHYLTTVDKPWVPDTDAMLLELASTVLCSRKSTTTRSCAARSRAPSMAKTSSSTIRRPRSTTPSGSPIG